MTPQGQALFDAARPIYGPRSVPVANSNDPIVGCDPIGFPRILLIRAPLNEMEIVQTPNRIFQFFRYQRVHREIWKSIVSSESKVCRKRRSTLS